MIPIPVYKEDNQIARTVQFIDNLTLPTGQYNIEDGRCKVGIKRLQKGEYKGRLVIMYYDEAFPTGGYAEFITEKEAYEICLNRGKAKVIEDYDINPDYEEEGEVEVL